MHSNYVIVDDASLVSVKPLASSKLVTGLGVLGVFLGLIAYLVYGTGEESSLYWASYYTSLLFFFGLSFGGVVLSLIFQIVRARWSATLRRIAEAHISFLPLGLVFILCTWFGRKHLFPWARAPRPGTEWWMQPWFVYTRHGILLALLIFLLWRFVRATLKTDFILLKNYAEDKGESWKGTFFFKLLGIENDARDFTTKSVYEVQNRLSTAAPALAILYALIYSLFAFEMVKAMDVKWVSNLFGAYLFMGNIYEAWAVLIIITTVLIARHAFFKGMTNTDQFWDLGKLLFGFAMVWGYFSLSQYLPQWYGNLPEETDWLYLRTATPVWKPMMYLLFTGCFLIPFIVLLSRDLKKIPVLLSVVAGIVLAGMWFEKYFIVFPYFTPDAVRFSFREIAVFLGFAGAHVLCYQWFLTKVPLVPVSHPLTVGKNDW